MMYPYITFGDGTEAVHSQIIHDGGVDKVLVYFERPREDGFDSAGSVEKVGVRLGSEGGGLAAA